MRYVDRGIALLRRRNTDRRRVDQVVEDPHVGVR